MLVLFQRPVPQFVSRSIRPSDPFPTFKATAVVTNVAIVMLQLFYACTSPESKKLCCSSSIRHEQISNRVCLSTAHASYGAASSKSLRGDLKPKDLRFQGVVERLWTQQVIFCFSKEVLITLQVAHSDNLLAKLLLFLKKSVPFVSF